MIYLKRLLYILLLTIVNVIGIIFTFILFTFIPFGIIISFIITGKFTNYFDIFIKYGEKLNNFIDKLEEKLSK